MSIYPIYLIIDEDKNVTQASALTDSILHGLDEGVYQVLRVNADGTIDGAYFPNPDENLFG